MPKLNGVSENILYLIALAKGKFVGAFQKCLHIEALEKAKPCPYFQNLPPASKKKKPLSRRGNHALIAASLNFYKRIENFFLMTHNITDSVLQLSL